MSKYLLSVLLFIMFVAFAVLFPVNGLVFAQEPVLPLGLSDDSNNDFGNVNVFEKRDRDDLPFGLTGFIEMRAGVRIQGQPYEKKAAVGETRMQFQAEKFLGRVSGRVTADFVLDPVADRYAIDLDGGDGALDLREAFLTWRVSDFLDIKAGRQILTWGSGDLVFLNDMFPKDFDSFFIGRDEEYLKAPSDALKASFFFDAVNFDVVYISGFDSDRYADGARVSTYDPFGKAQTGRSNILEVDRRVDLFDEDEIAGRLYRNIGKYETSLYGYSGYWKNPQGMDMVNRRATFPKISVFGASIRGPLVDGIANLEIAYYDSREDRDGSDPYNPNEQLRFLIGYERELASELTGGFQYNLERMLDYDEFLNNVPAGSFVSDENRHVMTLRMTKQLMNQNLILSMFGFFSPSDQDGYLRPRVNYKINDSWTAEAGGNIFYGEERSTFFGQLEDNTNIYFSLRYGF